MGLRTSGDLDAVLNEAQSDLLPGRDLIEAPPNAPAFASPGRLMAGWTTSSRAIHPAGHPHPKRPRARSSRPSSRSRIDTEPKRPWTEELKGAFNATRGSPAPGKAIAPTEGQNRWDVPRRPACLVGQTQAGGPGRTDHRPPPWSPARLALSLGRRLRVDPRHGRRPGPRGGWPLSGQGSHLDPDPPPGLRRNPRPRAKRTRSA